MRRSSGSGVRARHPTNVIAREDLILPALDSWIAQTQAAKTSAERDLHEAGRTQTQTLSHEELGDVASALGQAEPAEKAALYCQLTFDRPISRPPTQKRPS
ncbi:hypothetical protein MXD59_24570 [Frankia sp. Ag45/Mut15]|uniref:DUF222 domain-containing protein n=1 Tax=Frankia umida TaxID=573489 RepID=A0ABT0K526_9ACTN|nr:hypothetical protein [Frankia umida]MCK9878895.1 hypothetical protein [Frankia umida]